MKPLLLMLCAAISFGCSHETAYTHVTEEFCAVDHDTFSSIMLQESGTRRSASLAFPKESYAAESFKIFEVTYDLRKPLATPVATPPIELPRKIEKQILMNWERVQFAKQQLNLPPCVSLSANNDPRIVQICTEIGESESQAIAGMGLLRERISCGMASVYRAEMSDGRWYTGWDHASLEIVVYSPDRKMLRRQRLQHDKIIWDAEGHRLIVPESPRAGPYPKSVVIWDYTADLITNNQLSKGPS